MGSRDGTPTTDSGLCQVMMTFSISSLELLILSVDRVEGLSKVMPNISKIHLLYYGILLC